MADNRDYSSAFKRAFCCKNVNIERIKLLIKKSKSLYSEILNDAVKSNKCNLDVIKLLIDNGAELDLFILCDALRSKGCTLEIIKLLLEKGAKFYRSILQDALLFERWSSELITLLIKKGAYVHPMILSHAISSKKCNFITLKLLLDRGALVTDESLLCAIKDEEYCFEVVKFLLERRETAEFNFICYKLLGPLLESERCDKIEFIRLLLKYDPSLESFILLRVMRSGGGYKYKTIKTFLENGIIIEKNIFDCYKIDSSNVDASKIVLQYFFVQHFVTGSSQMDNTLNHENFFKISNFAKKTLYREMCDFFSSLLKEFIKMEKDEIDHDITLFSYVSNLYTSPCVERKTTYSYVNEILSRLYSKQYVYSRDVLCSTLLKTQNLFDLDMYVKKNESFYGDKVSLNYDSVIHLVSFLNKEDIINLIFAYWHRDMNKNVMKNCKRSCNLVEEQDELSLYVKRQKLE